MSDEKPKRKWIKGAIKHPGVLRKAAEHEGKSTSSYAHEHEHDSGKTGQRSRLALTLMGMHHAKPKHTMKTLYGKE